MVSPKCQNAIQKRDISQKCKSVSPPLKEYYKNEQSLGVAAF